MDDISVPVVAEELEEFRRKWKEELIHQGPHSLPVPTPPPPSNLPLPAPETHRSPLIPRSILNQPSSSSSKSAPQPSYATSPPPKPKPSNALQEISQNLQSLSLSKPKENDPLEIYKIAVQYEREGQLNDALAHYRLAFKLDSNVDILYHKYITNVIKNTPSLPSTSSTNPTTSSLQSHVSASPSKSITKSNTASQAFIQSCVDTCEGFVPLKANKPVHLSILPHEILLEIMKRLAVIDLNSVSALSYACKKWFLVSLEPSIWKHVSQATYKKAELEKCEDLYSLDWREFFIHHPRVRVEGTYISRCIYFRAGLAENSYNQPIHIVEYYRFLRFFRNGDCISLLTSSEPSAVIKNFNRPHPPSSSRSSSSVVNSMAKLKNFMTGTYTIKGSTVSVILTDKDRPKNVYFMELELKSGSKGKHNKLSWMDYYCMTAVGDHEEIEKTDFSLKNFRPFWFSRVKSYDTDSYW
ncbi:hypothetical protein BKA69DRAFT_1126828 [Paraphysoderma sedebokerense]|nr:hypothetical protein BKA69DRAFT_1126828 [Paraphysoderma sedebokerense]